MPSLAGPPRPILANAYKTSRFGFLAPYATTEAAAHIRPPSSPHQPLAESRLRENQVGNNNNDGIPFLSNSNCCYSRTRFRLSDDSET